MRLSERHCKQGNRDEDIMHNADLFIQLEEIVDGLEVAHRQAECMRRDMVKRLSDTAASRDFWDNNAAETLRQLEHYRTVLEMWRKGVPVRMPREVSSYSVMEVRQKGRCTAMESGVRCEEHAEDCSDVCKAHRGHRNA